VTTDDTVSANVLCMLTIRELICLLASDPEKMLVKLPPPFFSMNAGTTTVRTHDRPVATNMISRIL
jgi:hypothetical protein